jgi:hypothetical protein
MHFRIRDREYISILFNVLFNIMYFLYTVYTKKNVKLKYFITFHKCFGHVPE